MKKNAHCSYCGHRFADVPFPRTCDACGNTTWVNPLPVAVVLLPVDDGLLLVRRAIPPVGELALPGGYIDMGESWQEAGARELFEETGIRISADELTEIRVRSTPPPETMLIVFGLARPRRAAELPPFAANSEVSEVVIGRAPTRLAFALHSEVVDAWFSRKFV